MDAHGGIAPLDLNPGLPSSDPEGLTVYAGALYFAARDSEHGRKLWKIISDNEVAPVADVVRGAGSFDPAGLIVFNDALYMNAYSPANGFEWWKMDAQQQFHQVTDIYPGRQSSRSLPPSLAPGMGLVFENELYFRADDGAHGQELWKLDAEGRADVRRQLLFRFSDN